MTPQSLVLAELQPLLDALCEESISPEQLARLEELVLAHPEAEQHYIRFMSFHADLIGAIAGLPERPLPDAPKVNPKEDQPPLPSEEPALPTQNGSLATSAAAQNAKATIPPKAPVEGPPSNSVTYPSTRHDEIKRADEPRSKKPSKWAFIGPILPIVLIFGSVFAYQFISWAIVYREVAASQRVLDASREQLAKTQAERDATQSEHRKELDTAIAAEQKLAREYQNALRDALKAISEKDYLVRVTGPTHIEPGAPNKWQIETLRHSGSIARPKQMEIIVKDEKDTTLFRQMYRDTVGATTLELPASFWTKVKSGSDLFLEVSASADDRPTKALADRIPLARPVYVTHLATDKPLYQPGETIRFRSLTLDRSTLRPPPNDLHLRFRLRVPGDSVVPLDEGNGRLMSGLQPLLGPDNKPLRGIGVGEHQLSADAPGGEYRLELLEVNSAGGKEVLLETRKFIVNRYVPDTFEKKLEFDGKSYGPLDVVQARIEVSRTAGGPMKDARANVVASVDAKEFHTQKDQRFTIVADASGPKAVLNVRFKLPADLFSRKDAPNATLSINIQDGSDAEAIIRPIPLVTKTLLVEFFPEGGEMIEGVPGRVYFQVRTPQGKPADLKGVITDGTVTVAEVATLTDAEHPGVNRGHGVFTLTPKPSAKYFLKLQSPPGITEPTKDGYPLPVAKADGVALTALDAVTARGAPVRILIQARSASEGGIQVGRGSKILHIGAYARGRLIGQQRVEVEANKPVEVSLPGEPAAGGVTRVTVFEELTGEGPGMSQLVPRAERLIYRVPGEQLVLGVKPDRMQYTPGDKVRLELSAVNEQKQPTPAVLMVGVVNRSVIAMADNKTDRLLPTHFLLSGEVTHPSELEHADFLLTDHPKAGVTLDLLLGTQGWRRFAEQTGTAVDPVDRKEVTEMLISHGQQPSTPVELRKLEEQRVNAEFRPKIEAAVLKTADAESRSQAFAKGLTAAVDTAQQVYRTADSEYKNAKDKLDDFKSRFSGNTLLLFPVVLLLILVVWLVVEVTTRS
ncbi:MAG TPA: alpha-2-macroglobulin, partial [Gemmata sp.]|nr:alpha-2-macroglobulin [Gemmata sp.]